MDIRHLGKETLGVLSAKGMISCWADIMRLTAEDLVSFGGVGKKNADKIYEEIQRCWTKDFWRLLHGISIPLIGAASAKLLAEKLDPQNVLGTLHLVEKIPNFGPERFEQLRLFFTDPVNLQLFKEFVSNPLFNMKVPVKLSNKFENKTFIFTGSFNTQRTLHEANVKANGGKTSSSVTKSTTYVVAGRNATAHKVASAVKLGIPVIDEETFTKML